MRDDLDDFPTVMDAAKAKAAKTWRDEPDEAPVTRRPQPMTSRRRLDTGALAAVAVLGLFAAILAVSIFGGPPAETSEHPSYAAPTAAPAASPVVPAQSPQNDAAPASVAPTASQAEGVIEPINCAAEPGAWGCEPTPAPPVVQAAPAGPVAPPAEPAPAPQPTEPAGWHPPFVSGYSPTQNFVEVREP